MRLCRICEKMNWNEEKRNRQKYKIMVDAGMYRLHQNTIYVICSAVEYVCCLNCIQKWAYPYVTRFVRFSFLCLYKAGEICAATTIRNRLHMRAEVYEPFFHLLVCFCFLCFWAINVVLWLNRINAQMPCCTVWYLIFEPPFPLFYNPLCLPFPSHFP